MLSECTISWLYFLLWVFASLYFQTLGSKKKSTCINFPLFFNFFEHAVVVDLNSRMRKESSSHTLEALFKKGNILASCSFFWFTSLLFFNSSIISKMLFIHFFCFSWHIIFILFEADSHYLLKIYCSLGSVTYWHKLPPLESLGNTPWGKSWRQRNFRPKLTPCDFLI